MASIKPITKKMINSPESCVDDNLRGLVATYPALHLHPKHRVVTVTQQSDSGRVAILGGGGSGHEPFAAGHIGAGMLDGAVAGNVFASPPTGHVLYAIARLHKYNSGGVLVVIGNYTGDRLNFGKAIEKAKILGMKVEGLIVGEDVASSHNKTGGRSMCGEVFFYKLCGAMAAKGFDLQKIRKIALEANEAMATLGVCLSPCSLPGQPPLFEISPEEMELGAGVHGEAGIEKLSMATSKETVAMILDKIINHLKLKAGDDVVVMFDNLGGTSLLEMNIISADTKDYLGSKQIKVSRLYSAHFKTSLEMHGFQICVLKLTASRGELWRECMDLPTTAPGWVGGVASRGQGIIADDAGLLATAATKMSSGPSLPPPLQQLVRGSLLAACDEIIVSEALLNRLDSGCGDGDCGNTLRKFAQAITAYVSSASLERPAALLWDLSEIAERDMGGTSGGIYSLGLSAASQSLASATSNTPLVWSSAWRNAMDSITKYGGAEPGDRTMLDTLHTAWEVFEKNLKADIKTLLLATAKAAEDGAKATAKMTARAGRASYVSSNYTQDEDAGARAAAVWLNAILNYIANKY